MTNLECILEVFSLLKKEVMRLDLDVGRLRGGREGSMRDVETDLSVDSGIRVRQSVCPG